MPLIDAVFRESWIPGEVRALQLPSSSVVNTVALQLAESAGRFGKKMPLHDILTIV